MARRSSGCAPVRGALHPGGGAFGSVAGGGVGGGGTGGGGAVAAGIGGGGAFLARAEGGALYGALGGRCSSTVIDGGGAFLACMHGGGAFGVCGGGCAGGLLCASSQLGHAFAPPEVLASGPLSEAAASIPELDEATGSGHSSRGGGVCGTPESSAGPGSS